MRQQKLCKSKSFETLKNGYIYQILYLSRIFTWNVVGKTSIPGIKIPKPVPKNKHPYINTMYTIATLRHKWNKVVYLSCLPEPRHLKARALHQNKQICPITSQNRSIKESKGNLYIDNILHGVLRHFYDVLTKWYGPGLIIGISIRRTTFLVKLDSLPEMKAYWTSCCIRLVQARRTLLILSRRALPRRVLRQTPSKSSAFKSLKETKKGLQWKRPAA